MPLCALTMRGLRPGLGILLLGFLMLVPCAARADGEDPAVIEKVTNLNKKALAAYSSLDFEDARKLLKQALDLCGSAGLDKHPIKARTHVHMGVILIASKQQELGIKQFRKALEIQPDIQVTKSLANPEIMQAFAEASADTGGAADTSDAGAAAPPGGPADGAPVPTEVTGDITLLPVARGKIGRPIAISATVSPDFTGYAKLVLAYRPAGATEFVGVDMRPSGNRFVGEIPAEATRGSVVHYYVEAEAADDSPVASNGSEQKPYAVQLSVAGPREGAAGSGGGGDDGDENGPKFSISLAFGSGMGYVKGNGELNKDNKVNPGLAFSPAGQLVPEVGYFLMPRFRLSVQARIQYVTGRTPLSLDALVKIKPAVNLGSCGSDRVCSPGSPIAPSVFVRGSWFFGSGTFQPYLSLALGGGYIRHVVTFKSSTKICGQKGDQVCVDSVLAGPILVGPGGGVHIGLTPSLGVIVEANSVLAFPNFSYHVDLNAGMAARF